VYEEASAWLPQNSFLTHNYIGRSNWATVTDPYGNPDELFKGAMFDLRAYQTPMTKKKIDLTYKWGKKMMGNPNHDPMDRPLGL